VVHTAHFGRFPNCAAARELIVAKTMAIEKRIVESRDAIDERSGRYASRKTGTQNARATTRATGCILKAAAGVAHLTGTGKLIFVVDAMGRMRASRPSCISLTKWSDDNYWSDGRPYLARDWLSSAIALHACVVADGNNLISRELDSECPQLASRRAIDGKSPLPRTFAPVNRVAIVQWDRSTALGQGVVLLDTAATSLRLPNLTRGLCTIQGIEKTAQSEMHLCGMGGVPTAWSGTYASGN
jgi:hypothetical protein